jgi:hypothetical protein
MLNRQPEISQLCVPKIVFCFLSNLVIAPTFISLNKSNSHNINYLIQCQQPSHQLDIMLENG